MWIVERRFLVSLAFFGLEKVGGGLTLLKVREGSRHVCPSFQGILNDEWVWPGSCHHLSIAGVVRSDTEPF